MNIRLSVVLAAAGLLSLAACKDSGDGNTIKIGHYASLSGKEATFGKQTDDGVKLAADEINAAGGINGKKIEIVTEDTQSDKQVTGNAVKKLLGQDKVVALIGEVASGRSLVGAPLCQQQKIPMLSPASTNETVTEVGDFIFRICFIDPFQGTVMAKFAFNNLKVHNVAMLKDNTAPYSVGLANNFTTAFKALGGNIVEEQAFEGGQNDFKAQLTAIKAKNPEAIFLPAYYQEASLIAIQARQLGITCPILGGDGWDSPELTKGESGKAFEGCYFSNHYSEQDTSATVKNFIEKFKKVHNEVPGAMSALGYDALMIIAKVIKDNGGKTDPEVIKAGLAGLKNYPGVTGTITIDAKRNATKPVVVLQIKGGAFVYNTTISP